LSRKVADTLTVDRNVGPYGSTKSRFALWLACSSHLVAAKPTTEATQAADTTES
jgi:hypothetical protein